MNTKKLNQLVKVLYKNGLSEITTFKEYRYKLVVQRNYNIIGFKKITE